MGRGLGKAMAEDSTEAGIMVAPDVTYLGYDRRGWMVFGMSPMAPTLQEVEGSEEVTRKKVRVSLQEKDVELVQQTKALRVFVNPDPQEGDEWVVGGEIFEDIKSPQAYVRNLVNVPDITEQDKRLGPTRRDINHSIAGAARGLVSVVWAGVRRMLPLFAAPQADG